ncbi:hypothetical protein P7D22_17435 [Lichenihabitans sp. Uapishka_5]|uniref:hypothetical protein n=1 Tax=Lichenihabitans sp. Uapishka_5 TaxID=3037302 RepID=UPI0029E7E35E|nr:hypothetical protein [Lichenihabitans sp. Uapishka_5]MDX7952948.1 hypothetical protein [Lichenihabitans sp. Uapishka_5]
MKEGELLDDTLHRGTGSLDSSLLVSLIVVVSAHAGLDETHLGKLASFLRDRYAFFEILLIGPEDSDVIGPQLLVRLGHVAPQTRFMQVESGADFDRMAVHGYSECIGDLIVLTSSDELPYLDLAPILEKLRANVSLVRLRRRSNSLSERFGAFVVRFITGLQVDTRYFRSLGMTRQLLSELMTYPDAIPVFRFMAHRLFGPQTVLKVTMPPTRGGFRRLMGRIDTFARLLAVSAPRLLRIVSAVCLAVSLGSFLVFVYVVTTWMFKKQIAEGWTTTTSLLALSMFVQLNVSAVLSLGLSRALDRQERTRPPRLVSEATASDLFREVTILNVEPAHMFKDGPA